MDTSLLKAATDIFMNRPSKQAEYAYGLRKPGSKRLSWNDAFIIAKCVGHDDITACMFKNGMDYIGHPKSYQEAMNTYCRLVSDGWLPMDREDLENVSGMENEITEETNFIPELYKPKLSRQE